MEIGKKEMQLCIQEDLPFSIIMIDVDHFKKINDSYGHLVGDIVLKIIVDRMHNCLKKDTLTARYGGEEFVVMMSLVNHDRVLNTAERIRRSIEGNPFLIGELSLNITISLGVATLAKPSETFLDVINKADRALYRAKQSGRNRVETL